MKTFLKKIVRWMVYFIALLVILAATFVSASRMFTPYLNNHREDFEKWASDQLHVPIQIERIHITWYYLQPVLTFEKVVILDNKNHLPNIEIQQIKVNLQLFPSLFHWKPLSKYIRILGANLTLREQKPEQFSIEGTHPFAMINNVMSNTAQKNPILLWILSQPHLVLNDINITYISPHKDEKFVTLNKLSLVNTSSTHDLSGAISLNQEIPLTMEFHLQMVGDITTLDQTTMQGYFYVEGISLAQWFQQTKWHNLQLMQGLGSAKIWVKWNHGQFQQISSELQIYDLVVKSLFTEKQLNVSRINGHLIWQRDGDKQIFSGHDILIDFPEHLWPTTGFTLLLQQRPTNDLTIQSLQIDYLNLADTVGMGLDMGLIPPKVEKILSQLDLGGELHSFKVQMKPPSLNPQPLQIFTVNSSDSTLQNPQKATLFHSDQHDSHTISSSNITLQNLQTQPSFFEEYINALSFEFTNLSFNTFQAIPKVNHLTGAFQWNGNQGGLTLDSHQAVFELNTVFAEALAWDELKGSITFQTMKNALIIIGKNLNFINKDLSTEINFNAALPENASPNVDLTADFSMNDITPITQYLPVKILEPKLLHWLQNTFYGGRIINGKVILKGQLNDFPFDNNNGQFSVNATVRDLDFEYAPDWPGIKHLSGDLLFSGHTMTANVVSGTMVDLPLKKTIATIPYIGADQPQTLIIQSDIEADLSQAWSYIQHSPLQKIFGNNSAAIQILGSMSLQLNLSIPLKTPEKTQIVGDLTLPKADLTIPDWNISLHDINGALHFTDIAISPTKLQAVFLNQPIILNVDSTLPPMPSMVKVSFQSKMSKALLQTLVPVPGNFFQGATNYNAQLNITSAKQSTPSELIITSNLKGVSLNLPDVYGKKAEEIRPFQLVIDFNNNNRDTGLKIDYGNVLSAALIFRKEQTKTQFYSGELRLGAIGTATFQDKPGLLLSGQFIKWDLTTWQGYLDTLAKTNSSGTTNNTKPFNVDHIRGIDLTANEFAALGMTLHAARIQAYQEKDRWSISLKSTEMMGQLSLPHNIKKPIQAVFQYVYISPMEGVGKTLNPTNIPPISFVSNDVRFKDMSFDKVTFNSIPSSSGMIIQTLRSDSPIYNLNAKGEWRVQKNISKTVLQGNLETKDVAKFLKKWGMNASNLVESGGAAQFNLSWNGALYDPQLNTVMGDISVKLSAGRIIDLSNSTDAKMGIGKMLNIFNLSSLPRRLTLNFKDFKNGYSFDSMQGDFTLKNGSLYTQNTVFDGPIARIEINGRMGYVNKDYDINFSVTPYGMTSSLPLVATVV
ncbi:MAG: TIGR02099 family protein, partial [Gammaproteobacteria bacterium]|nr:TIGR02099 family protein [Gammaproteobacteria bacterium]